MRLNFRLLFLIFRLCAVEGSMDNEIETVLWSAEQIAERVSQLAKEIADNFKPPAFPPVIVGVATGAFLFLADIVRNINLPLYVDIIRAESYGFGTESSGDTVISSKLKIDVAGKHVILVKPTFFPFLRSNRVISRKHYFLVLD